MVKLPLLIGWFNGETVDLHMKPLVSAPGWQGREGELEELGQATGSRACRGHRSDFWNLILIGIQWGKQPG